MKDVLPNIISIITMTTRWIGQTNTIVMEDFLLTIITVTTVTYKKDVLYAYTLYYSYYTYKTWVPWVQ